MEPMPPTQSPDDGEMADKPPKWSADDERSFTPHGGGPFVGSGPAAVELEPGWSASRALMRLSDDELLEIMLRPSFRPVKDLDLVPVSPCSHCLDGGMRVAGSVRTRRGREPVRACDTCATVEIGDGPLGRPLH
jgi:hypothetical protein